MNIRKATRKFAKIKMALQGPSGSGKTYSALLLAKGLAGDFGLFALSIQKTTAQTYTLI